MIKSRRHFIRRSRLPHPVQMANILVLALLIAACSTQPAMDAPELAAATGAPASTATAVPSPAPATPSPAPSPTPEPARFSTGSTIAGVDVGGLEPPAAIERVAAALEAYSGTVVLQTADYSTTLELAEVVDLPSADQLVAQALPPSEAPVTIPLEPAVDTAAVQQTIEGIAPSVEQSAATTIISDVKALTETFTFARRPGNVLDVDRSVGAIVEALADGKPPATIELVIRSSDTAPLPMAELERVLREHAGYWKGVAGFYVHNLETGETIAYNADTVFSGASVMKVPIMIFAYSRLGELDDQQRVWMRKMIIDSENLEANDLLAAAVGGQGTEDALRGVNEMTQMLRDLGLQHTYQLIPYESGEWLIQQSMLPGGGPLQEGEPPYTAADRYLRTTPREMGELFVMLDQCAHGSGPLLEKVGGKLSEALCDEMIDWLQQPHDPERMVAGLPPGVKVAHKGGWIDDMQSDVGIVESPGGRYVAAIYIWRDGYVTDVHATPSPYLGDFSHTIYTFFNPVPLEDEAARAAGQ